MLWIARVDQVQEPFSQGTFATSFPSIIEHIIILSTRSSRVTSIRPKQVGDDNQEEIFSPSSLMFPCVLRTE